LDVLTIFEKEKMTMKKIIVFLTLTTFFISLGVSAMASEIKVSADLEVYYEYADDTDGVNDDDRFQTNQLYLTIDGKFDGYDARLKLDGADMENETGAESTSNDIEEANFTIKEIAGSPVTVVFGKDEMPFGLDYDKYLTDPLVHYYEIDKVWGVHTIIDIKDIGNFAFGLYESRNTDATTNEMGDHFTTRLIIDKLVDNLTCEVSFANEKMNDNDVIIADANGDLISYDEDEQKYSVGAVYEYMNGANVNLEYTGFSSKGGVADYDPGLISAGTEYRIDDSYLVYARIEYVLEDAKNSEQGQHNATTAGGGDPDYDVEEYFYMIGASYSPEKNYTLSLEYTNYSTANYSSAAGLSMSDTPDVLESAIKFGIRAKF
jgi:hypothetical protein